MSPNVFEGIEDDTDSVDLGDVAEAFEVARNMTDDPVAAATLAAGAVVADELRRIREMLWEVGATPAQRTVREMRGAR